MNRMKTQLLAGITACMLSLAAGAPVLAATDNVVAERPSGAAMAGDLLLARPALLVATGVGVVINVVAAPFSLLGGNFQEATNELVVVPFKATFLRCLGCTLKHMQEDE